MMVEMSVIDGSGGDMVPLQQVRVARLDALEGVSTCATLQGRGVMAHDVQNGPYTAG